VALSFPNGRPAFRPDWNHVFMDETFALISPYFFGLVTFKAGLKTYSGAFFLLRYVVGSSFGLSFHLK